MRMASGPGISCHSFSHGAFGVSKSFRMRERIAGSFNLSIIFLSPPSCAQGGMNADVLLNHAGYAYVFAPTSTPLERAASIFATMVGIKPHCGFPAALR